MEFWELTPFEFSLKVTAFGDRLKQEQEERITLTYLGAAWQRVNKLPSLKKILGNDSVKKEMTPQEMLEEIKKLNASMGGTTC